MLLSRSSSYNLKYVFVIFAVLVSLNLWSFRLVPDSTYRLFEAVLLGALILFVFASPGRIKERLLFRENVILFIVIPLISGISAFIYHEQPLHLSLLILRTNFFWLLYFVLHRFNIREKDIIRMMFAVGLIWMAITVIQQFTYPGYLFYSREENEGYSILRAGVYRFMAFGHQYGTFVFIFSLYMFFQKRKAIYVLMMIISLVAFYYYGTRQFALAALICLPVSILFLKGQTRIIALIVSVILGGVFFYFRDQLFGDYVVLTQQQLQMGEDVRRLSASFWLHEYWPHWTSAIFGNGRGHIASEYGVELYNIRVKYHYYRSDVGIAGAFNEFGIFYVLNILIVSWKGIRGWYLLKADKYLVLLFVNLIVLLPTSLYYSHFTGIPFYCCLFYLFEKAWARKRQAKAVKAATKIEPRPGFLSLSN